MRSCFSLNDDDEDDEALDLSFTNGSQITFYTWMSELLIKT